MPDTSEDAHIDDSRKGVYLICELAIWIGLILTPYLIFNDGSFFAGFYSPEFYRSHPILSTFVTLASTGIFAFFFVFDGLPLQTAAENVRRRKGLLRAVRNLPRLGADDRERRSGLFAGLPAEHIIAIEASQNLDPRELLALYCANNEQVSRRIYRQSSAYIMFGVLIAASGLSLFYYMTVTTAIDTDISKRIISIIPNIGVLIFIELIAFFFLRQHRLAMDEFRYYEQVKRIREENLIIMKMFAENKDVVSAKDVIGSIRPYQQPDTISKENTTELIELRRAIKDEVDVVERLVNAAKWLNPSNKSADK